MLVRCPECDYLLYAALSTDDCELCVGKGEVCDELAAAHKLLANEIGYVSDAKIRWLKRQFYDK